MYFSDRLVLDAPKRTKDGYLAVRAKAARVGVYDYTGRDVDPNNEHGLRDKPLVKVLRDENTVFDRAAIQSFIGKPITNDHPSTPVTRDNWRDHARGTIMGAIRDGDYLSFDLMLTDGATIDDVEAGKRELSNGYSVDLEYGQFTAKDGTVCDVRQAKITGGNHVAIVDRGRAGPDCKINDAFAVCDNNPAALEAIFSTTNDGGGFMPHTLTIDGLQVPNVSDEAKACIEKLQGVIKDSADAQAAAKTAHDKEMAAKDAEIDKLKSQVVDEATIDARAAEKADVLAAAKPFIGDADTAGKSVADIKRMAVAKGVNDEAVKDKSDDYVAARFDALCDSGIVATQNIGAPVIANDSANIRDAVKSARYA